MCIVCLYLSMEVIERILYLYSLTRVQKLASYFPIWILLHICYDQILKDIERDIDKNDHIKD